MRGLTFREPGTALSYIAGVYLGDGYLTNGGATIGLHVKDRDFAEAFATAIDCAFGLSVQVRQEGKYWRARIRRKGLFDRIPFFIPRSNVHRAYWLRGLFDSDGNAQLYRSLASPGAKNRRVAIYNTTATTIDRACRYLQYLGICCKVNETSAHLQPSHHGSAVVLELKVVGGRESFQAFAEQIGSCIDRKRRTLTAIATYEEKSEYCKRGGLASAVVRWGGRTHCNHGHRLSGNNIKLTRRGAKRCRTCARRQRMESYYRRKAAKCAV